VTPLLSEFQHGYASGVSETRTLSVEQLAGRVGMSVRTVRFYAGRGLIPPPRREGRNGYYGLDHLARLELVKELQAHGFTLSAIEGYLANIPEHATPEDVALHRTLLAPWSPAMPERLGREELQTRAGRALSDDDLEVLVAVGIIEPTPTEDQFNVAGAHLAIGMEFLDAGMPVEAALATRQIVERHGRALARELTERFRTQVWPSMKDSGQPPELLTRMIERFKPLTVQALVTAYEEAVDDEKRRIIQKRT
jgi:DNA-binding transcriptional MerR regulator